MIDKQKMYDLIETEIMDHFDFKQVHEVMVQMKWQWFDIVNDDGSGVPEIYEIRQKARQLLRDAYHGLLSNEEYPDFCTGTGGLYATAYRDSIQDTVYFKLQFVLESWDNLD